MTRRSSRIPDPKARAAFLALALASFIAAPLGALDFYSKGEPAELAEALTKAMSDEEIVGQLFMVAYRDPEPSQAFLASLKERSLGGIKIFGWNAKDDAQLCRSIGELQKTALEGRFRIPLLIATDQEGGWIRHVLGRTSESPGAMANGASGFAADAYESGKVIARELKAIGINMNFAPSVDVASNPKSWVIGSRSFSSDPRMAGILGAAFAKGSSSERVIPTAKHFPGHGDTALDSHLSLPVIDADWDTLWNRELLPFRMMAAEGAPAVMSGHLAFPKLTGGKAVPASLSSYFLQDLLRGKLGYSGVIVTDDLCMSGACDYAGSVAQAALMALEAGDDIVMFSSADEGAWKLVVQRCAADAVFRGKCRTSAARVLALKLRYLRGAGAVPVSPDPKALDAALPDKEGESIFISQAGRAVTWVKRGDLPLGPRSGRILLAGQFDNFFKEGLVHYPQAKTFRFGYMNQASERAAEALGLTQAAAGADVVIICVANDTSLLLLDALKGRGKKVIVLSVLSPAGILGYTWPDAIVAAYSYSRVSLAAAFSAIRGDIEARGEMPLREARKEAD
jgi:beta-N-acetylhexosaminidase